MKKIIILATSLFTISTGLFAQLKAGKQDITKHTVLYSCPTHHDVLVHNPAKCPNCGMDLNLSQKEQQKMVATNAYSCPVNAVSLQITKGHRLNISLKEGMKMQATRLYEPSIQQDVPGLLVKEVH